MVVDGLICIIDAPFFTYLYSNYILTHLWHSWDSYSKEAHVGVTQMYVDDERFTPYYDEKQPGTAAFLRDAVLVYTGMKK